MPANGWQLATGKPSRARGTTTELGVNLAGLNLFGLIRMLLFLHRWPIRTRCDDQFRAQNLSWAVACKLRSLASIEVCTASKEGGNLLIEDTEA